jgi:hypothetical protein
MNDRFLPFEAYHCRPAEWREYVARLDAAIEAHWTEIRRLIQDGDRMAARELIVEEHLYHHRSRALYELRRSERS